MSISALSPQLALALIQKGILRHNTEIDAAYKGVDLSGAAIASVRGNFIITSAKQTPSDIIFETRDTSDGSKRSIKCTDVYMIDGMDPSRFAGIYGLNETGDPIKQAARRGRKPKAKVVAQ